MKVMFVLVVALFVAGSATAGIQGQWLLDDGSGNVAADSSGNGADMTLDVGSANWITDHPTYGTGFSFFKGAVQ